MGPTFYARNRHVQFIQVKINKISYIGTLYFSLYRIPFYCRPIKEVLNCHQSEPSILFLQVEDSKKLGEWAGLCKIDREGKARKVVGCSCVVVKVSCFLSNNVYETRWTTKHFGKKKKKLFRSVEFCTSCQ